MSQRQIRRVLDIIPTWGKCPESTETVDHSLSRTKTGGPTAQPMLSLEAYKIGRMRSFL
jgi:hypothetical protein